MNKQEFIEKIESLSKKISALTIDRVKNNSCSILVPILTKNGDIEKILSIVNEVNLMFKEYPGIIEELNENEIRSVYVMMIAIKFAIEILTKYFKVESEDITNFNTIFNGLRDLDADKVNSLIKQGIK